MNYNEITADYPNLFIKEDGTQINTIEEWEIQRKKIKALVSEHIYGEMPAFPTNVKASIIDEEIVYNGKGISTSQIVWADGINDDFHMALTIVRPNRDGRFPVIICIGYNDFTIKKQLVSDGRYIFAIINRNLAAPNSVDSTEEYFAKYKYPAVILWGMCAVTCVEYLKGFDFVDMDKLAVTGHSRDGKAALFAGMYDERIKVVLPAGSGCGGCSSYKLAEEGAEKIDQLMESWPTWLNRLGRYVHNYDALPIDMHFVRSLIAPRAILNTDADTWPWEGVKGSYINKTASQKAFDLYGVPNYNAMTLHHGQHEYNDIDFGYAIEFCDYVFYDREPESDLYMEFF